jgi:hypothetical protein
MLDGGLADYIPYVFPAVYAAVLVVLHVFVIVRPTQALLREEWGAFTARHPKRADEAPKPSQLNRPVPRQTDILAGWRALHARDVDAVEDLDVADLRVQLRARPRDLPPEGSEDLRAAARDAARALQPNPAPVVRSPARRGLRGQRPGPGSAPPREGVEREARATLKEVLAVVFDSRDTAYEEAAEVYRKTLWLALIGAVGIVALGLAVDQGHIFFLVGAIGGLMSRLTRILSRRPRANDYGASWSTLILAPIAGGLAGWLGVVLTEALASEDFGVLDAATFEGIFSNSNDLTGSAATVALAVSFLFGFSERLINRAATAAEERVVPKLPASEAQPQR